MTRLLTGAVCCAVTAGAIAGVPVSAAQADRQTLGHAQRLFYNARYEEAAAVAFSLRASGTQDLENDEVRTTALLFVLRGLLNGQDAHNGDKAAALKACTRCPDVLAAFEADLHHGQRCSRRTRPTSARASPGAGSISSSIPGCPGARDGCSAAATKRRGSPRCATRPG